LFFPQNVTHAEGTGVGVGAGRVGAGVAAGVVAGELVDGAPVGLEP